MTTIILTSFIISSASVSGDTTILPQWAQEKKPVKVACYLGAGGSIIVIDNPFDWDPKYHVLSRLDFTLTPKLSFWVGADYYFHSFEDIPGTSRKEKKLSILNIAIDFKITTGILGPSKKSYLFIGAGGASQSYSDSIYNIPGDTLNGRTVTVPADGGASFEIGGGVEFKKFFIQGKYLVLGFGKKTRSLIPITLGVKF